MKSAAILLTALTALFTQIPGNDPNGVWEADGGTRFELRLTGLDLHVRLAPDSNPLLKAYEVELKRQDEMNTYVGKGFFVAKVKEDKDCRFDVDWVLVVANTDHIAADIPAIVPDPDTCEVKERHVVQVDLARK